MQDASRNLRLIHECEAVALRLDGTEVLEALAGASLTAARLGTGLESCSHFEFLDVNLLSSIADRDSDLGAQAFWGQVNELLTLACRSTCRAVRSLIDGVLWAVGSQNE